MLTAEYVCAMEDFMHDDRDDAPELTAALRRRLRPATEVLPPEVVAAFKRSPGRPKIAEPKQPVSLRLSPKVVAFYKATGPGWQTRVEEILVKAMSNKGVG